MAAITRPKYDPSGSGQIIGYEEWNPAGGGVWTPISASTTATTPTPTSTPTPTPTLTPTPTTPTTLTQAQIQQYYATEGQKANPLSPLDWLARQQAPTPTPIPIPTTTPITSAITQPKTEIPYVSPTQTYIPTVAPVTQPLTPTPSEQKAQTLTEQLQALNLSLVGESAYTAEQKITQGVSGLETTQADLTAQLQQLQRKSQDLQNQYNYTIPNLMQEAAAGRGITTGVLERMTAGELRKVQIAQGAIASEALIVSASLDAINGNLVTANKKVQEAVATMFDPIREEINAKMANLSLILGSPEATLADKNRATQQLEIQNAQKAAINAAETEAENIYKIAIEAAAQGVDAVTLQRIQNAKSVIEATQIAQSAGVFEEKVTESQEFTRVKQIVDMYPNEWGQAASKIDATFGAGTSTRYDAYLKSVYQEGGVGTTGGKPLTAGDTAIRNWILKNKQANPNVPYYDLWGQLAEEMRKQGLNPSNYDKIFWEILHPEGEAGYAKYQGGTTTGTIENPFK